MPRFIEISYHTFPNPATNSLLFQFNANQTGQFLLELVNTAGQVVQHKAVTLAGTSQIRSRTLVRRRRRVSIF